MTGTVWHITFERLWGDSHSMFGRTREEVLKVCIKELNSRIQWLVPSYNTPGVYCEDCDKIHQRVTKNNIEAIVRYYGSVHVHEVPSVASLGAC